MSKLRLLATVSHLALAVAEFYVRRERERAGWYSTTITGEGGLIARSSTALGAAP